MVVDALPSSPPLANTVSDVSSVTVTVEVSDDDRRFARSTSHAFCSSVVTSVASGELVEDEVDAVTNTIAPVGVVPSRRVTVPNACEGEVIGSVGPVVTV